jgi:hypothetical protein
MQCNKKCSSKNRAELRGHVNDAAVFDIVKDFVGSFTELVTKVSFKSSVPASHARVLLAFAFATQAALLETSIALIAKATRDLNPRPNVKVKRGWGEDVTLGAPKRAFITVKLPTIVFGVILAFDHHGSHRTIVSILVLVVRLGVVDFFPAILEEDDCVGSDILNVDIQKSCSRLKHFTTSGLTGKIVVALLEVTIRRGIHSILGGGSIHGSSSS